MDQEVSVVESRQNTSIYETQIDHLFNNEDPWFNSEAGVVFSDSYPDNADSRFLASVCSLYIHSVRMHFASLKQYPSGRNNGASLGAHYECYQMFISRGTDIITNYRQEVSNATEEKFTLSNVFASIIGPIFQNHSIHLNCISVLLEKQNQKDINIALKQNNIIADKIKANCAKTDAMDSSIIFVDISFSSHHNGSSLNIDAIDFPCRVACETTRKDNGNVVHYSYQTIGAVYWLMKNSSTSLSSDNCCIGYDSSNYLVKIVSRSVSGSNSANVEYRIFQCEYDGNDKKIAPIKPFTIVNKKK